MYNDYIKKNDVINILYQAHDKVTRHNYKKVFWDTWHKIINLNGLKESVVRCNQCINVFKNTDFIYCQVFNCKVPKDGYCFKGEKQK